VFSFAEPKAAKIETQHRKSEAVQRLHRMKNNLVMHGAAVNRVWMANKRRMSRVLRAGVEQGFEAAHWAFNEQRPNCRTGEGQVVRLQELNH
jgi:hypothetical protein